MNRDSRYNSDPVFYCEGCLSLEEPEEWVIDGMKIECCKYCGSQIFGKANIFEWEKMFEDKYKCNFLKTNKTWKELMKMQKGK